MSRTLAVAACLFVVAIATAADGKYAVKVEDGGIYVDPVPVTPRSTR